MFVPVWYSFKSALAPIFNTSSVDPSLESPIKIFLVFTSKSPPSCGEVSSTTLLNLPLTDELKAAISTPSTVPVTAIFPVTEIPVFVVSNLLLPS